MTDTFFNAASLPPTFLEDLNVVDKEYFSWKDAEQIRDPNSMSSESSDSGEEEGTSELYEDKFVAEECPEFDKVEEKTVADFLEKGCSCTFGPNKECCSKRLTKDLLLKSRAACFELSPTELDLVILSQLQANIRTDYGENRRKRYKPTYCYQGSQICRETFLKLHGIGKKRFQNVMEHYRVNGLSPRVHGNKGRLPSHTCPFETVAEVASFINNFAQEHAIVLPGRIPGFKRTDIKVLPSSETKASIFRMYQQSVDLAGKKAVGYSKFVDLWNELIPHVVISKPMTDLCHTCQKNNSRIYRSANLPENEKSQLLKELESHLLNAERERSFYRSACGVAKETLSINLEKLDFTQERRPCSFNASIHYSFDYAQQLHIPSNPLQPGPIYFKTPRKCGIFGVCCEGIPRQVNYLIDESVQTGKGANSVISYLHHFFNKHGLGETDVHMHADNCAGQNKNNYLLWYWAWRTIAGFHNSCLYSFLIVGHTKFACDWCFGLLKQKVRKTFISSLYDLATAVDESTVSGVNVSELCGLHDGTVLVPVYDWASFLATYFKKFPNIKNFHHFRFTKEEPGVMYFRQFSDTPESRFLLLKKNDVLPPRTLPTTITPSGLDFQRKSYLYREIREFCREGTEDLIAPSPE